MTLDLVVFVLALGALYVAVTNRRISADDVDAAVLRLSKAGRIEVVVREPSACAASGGTGRIEESRDLKFKGFPPDSRTYYLLQGICIACEGTGKAEQQVIARKIGSCR